MREGVLELDGFDLLDGHRREVLALPARARGDRLAAEAHARKETGGRAWPRAVRSSPVLCAVL